MRWVNIGLVAAVAAATAPSTGPAQTRLPAPITIVSGRHAFEIDRNAVPRRVANPAGYPRDSAWFPASGTWFAYRHGHLVVGLGARQLWRSREPLAAGQVGLIVAGSGMIAFQHAHRLYLARDGGPDHPVASREEPIGWTAQGLYAYRYAGRDLVLRGDDGRLLGAVGHPTGSEYFVSGGALYFVGRGAVLRAVGTDVREVASLRALGFSPRSVLLQPLGAGLELSDGSRIVWLRSDGTVGASTAVPRRHGEPETISSSLALGRRGAVVAFTASAGDAPSPNSAKRVAGTETVFLLRAGARAAVAIHSERVVFKPCERGASVEWHGHWLLYSASEGNLAVIDATGRHRSVELTGLAERVTGTRSGFSAYWSGQVPRL